MDSVLAVVTPAASSDLCTLRVAKLELGIEDARFDSLLKRWITVGSSQIATFCNRVFGTESVTEIWRIPLWQQLQPAFPPAVRELKLRRFPVLSIASVSEDGSALDPSLYESDPAAGFLWRLNQQDRRIVFQAFKRINVAYTAGYALPDGAPPSLQQDCLSIRFQPRPLFRVQSRPF